MPGDTPELWLLAVASGLGTYACRGLAVPLSGRIRPESELFKWVACVAYAMIAGLIMRIILMPSGILATSALPDRLVACLLGLAAYYLARRNLLVGVMTGAAVIVAAGWLRS
jgi:branched-subunit amino acid transport protein